MRTEVVIIGSGPSGLLLGQLLGLSGIASIVLERASRDHVLSRVRAGVLEQGTIELVAEAGAARRLQAEGLRHGGISLAFDNHLHHIDLADLTGDKHITIYGQTDLTHDLMIERDREGLMTVYEVQNVEPQGFGGDSPSVSYEKDGVTHRIDCDFIAGCDGFHGISRKSVPAGAIRSYERVWPFGWLGVLADVPPVHRELIYASHARGFALCSMRSLHRSRYYVQCPLMDQVECWSDIRFWDELRRRLPENVASRIVTGPAIEKSIAPVRSFVAEPMRFGRLFLVGDAAHIVPPTGAKGLNLAASDVRYLYLGLREFYRDKSAAGIDAYSQRALARVWKTVLFTWWMTRLLHRLPESDDFCLRLQQAELAHVVSSPSASASLAENYVGLPY